MKIGKLGLVLGLGILLGALAANATPIEPIILNTASLQYLGSVDPSTPANETQEVDFINKLLELNKNTSFTPFGPHHSTLVRSGNEFVGLPKADKEPKFFKAEQNDNTPIPEFNIIDITGWTYLYAKYGNGGDTFGGRVWYVGDLDGMVEVPNQGLSHWSVYNPKTSVPDGGTTVMLLGAALIGLGAIRRKIR